MACWGKEKEFVLCFSGEDLGRERDNLEDLVVDGNVILKWTLESGRV
jgi:hypothetical protein